MAWQCSFFGEVEVGHILCNMFISQTIYPYCGVTGKNEKTKAMRDAGMSTTQINEDPLGFSPKVKNASAVAVLVNMWELCSQDCRLGLPWTIPTGVSWTLWGCSVTQRGRSLQGSCLAPSKEAVKQGKISSYLATRTMSVHTHCAFTQVTRS